MSDDIDEAFARGLADGELPPSIIPADWWDKRPELQAIRDHAVGRYIPPDGLLAAVFAELSMRTPVHARLPRIIGAPAALNFGAVVVGETGTGKSVGGRMTLADSINGFITGEIAPLSTGEGITAALCDPPASKNDRPMPHGRPVLVTADEGRILEQLVDRQGSRVLGDLCTAVTGGELGQRNATKNLNRYVPAGTYRLAVLFGIQPMYLRGPLADLDGGLPQRFWFVRLSGHLLKARAEPPGDKLHMPDINAMKFPGGYVNVPERIRHQIQADHVERVQAADRGEDVARDSHRNLLRIRLATFLAFLAGRSAPTDGDWELALPLVDSSDAVVALGAALRTEQARQAARAETARAVRHGVAVDAAVETSRLERVARKVAKWVRTEPGQTRKDIRGRLSASSRALCDDAIDHAAELGWLVEVSETSHTGDDRRSLYPGEVKP